MSCPGTAPNAPKLMAPRVQNSSSKVTVLRTTPTSSILYGPGPTPNQQPVISSQESAINGHGPAIPAFAASGTGGAAACDVRRLFMGSRDRRHHFILTHSADLCNASAWQFTASFRGGYVPFHPCSGKQSPGWLRLAGLWAAGVGDGLRGNDGGAVDSRFRGNDRWAGMGVAGSDGWVGMVERGNDGRVGMTEGRG